MQLRQKNSLNNMPMLWHRNYSTPWTISLAKIYNWTYDTFSFLSLSHSLLQEFDLFVLNFRTFHQNWLSCSIFSIDGNFGTWSNFKYINLQGLQFELIFSNACLNLSASCVFCVLNVPKFWHASAWNLKAKSLIKV